MKRGVKCRLSRSKYSHGGQGHGKIRLRLSPLDLVREFECGKEMDCAASDLVVWPIIKRIEKDF